MKQTFAILIVLIIASCKAQSFKLSDKSLAVGQIHTNYNILFALAKPELLADQCKLTLDSILTFLNTNSTYIIEIGVHTDFRGDDKDNKILSQSRADKLKDYFVNNGIDTKRIIPLGYGETNPLQSLKVQRGLGTDVKNVNRRVTIKILKK